MSILLSKMKPLNSSFLDEIASAFHWMMLSFFRALGVLSKMYSTSSTSRGAACGFAMRPLHPSHVHFVLSTLSWALNMPEHRSCWVWLPLQEVQVMYLSPLLILRLLHPSATQCLGAVSWAGVGSSVGGGSLVCSAGGGSACDGASQCLQVNMRFCLTIWSTFHLLRCVHVILW